MVWIDVGGEGFDLPGQQGDLRGVQVSSDGAGGGFVFQFHSKDPALGTIQILPKHRFQGHEFGGLRNTIAEHLHGEGHPEKVQAHIGELQGDVVGIVQSDDRRVEQLQLIVKRCPFEGG